jgi:hypothetical protein
MPEYEEWRRPSRPSYGDGGRRESRPTPSELCLGADAVQGLTIAINAILNRVVRISGGSLWNNGWPYFVGTYKEYPAFKRKFRSYQANNHEGTPPRELVQMFREMCMPEKIALHIKKVKSMTAHVRCWMRSRSSVSFCQGILGDPGG